MRAQSERRCYGTTLNGRWQRRKAPISKGSSFWTDDAVVLAPGMPAVVGKDALRGYVEGSLRIPGFSISWNSTDVAFSPDGRLAIRSARMR